MTREPNEVCPPVDFDADAHIAAFLQTSSVYLGVSADQVMASWHSPRQPIPAILAREAQHA